MNNLISRPQKLFAVLVLLVLLFQPFKVGFEKGHHGWVSSHTLSQISHASPENYFLGYLRKATENEAVDYVYFDRYPVIFSGLTHMILSPFWGNFEWSVYLARQWMNIIFLISAWLLWRLISGLIPDQRRSLTVTAFTLSASYFIHYKDMVHFDQPALIGCLLALNGIIDFEQTGKKKFLWWGVLLGPLLGRGYAVIFFLASWIFVKFILELKASKNFMNAMKALPLLFLFISIPMPTLMLANNVMSEAKIRNVDWKKTSIVESALLRMGVNNYVPVDTASKEKKFKWPSFLMNQINRFFDFVTPYPLWAIHIKNFKDKGIHYSSILPKALFQLMLVFLLFRGFRGFWSEKTITQRHMYLYVCAGGILWVLVMRNLANFHEYVTLYLFGSLILIWDFLSEEAQKRGKDLLPLALATVVIALVFNFGKMTYVASTVNWQPGEFERVKKILESENVTRIKFVSPDGGFFIDGAPYAESFFLRDFVHAVKEGRAEREIHHVKVNGESKFEVRKI
ncbi:MAG: hypothetical protein V4598_17140 [Bdellovibrionota bacterium]